MKKENGRALGRRMNSRRHEVCVLKAPDWIFLEHGWSSGSYLHGAVESRHEGKRPRDDAAAARGAHPHLQTNTPGVQRRPPVGAMSVASRSGHGGGVGGGSGSEYNGGKEKGRPEAHHRLARTV